MFEICLEDVSSFRIKSIKLYEDDKVRYMVLLAEIVLVHTYIPSVQIVVSGGLLARSGYYFTVRPKDKQDILTAQAVRRIEQILTSLMDEWTEAALSMAIGSMY